MDCLINTARNRIRKSKKSKILLIRKSVHVSETWKKMYFNDFVYKYRRLDAQVLKLLVCCECYKQKKEPTHKHKV